jgi:hypothetical protein
MEQQDFGVGRTKLLEQAGAAVDVGKEERDGTAGEMRHSGPCRKETTTRPFYHTTHVICGSLFA